MTLIITFAKSTLVGYNHRSLPPSGKNGIILIVTGRKDDEENLPAQNPPPRACPRLQKSYGYRWRAESFESQKAQRSLPLDRYKEQPRQEGQLEGMITEPEDFAHDLPAGR
jgi:hypothetical protein